MELRQIDVVETAEDRWRRNLRAYLSAGFHERHEMNIKAIRQLMDGQPDVFHGQGPEASNIAIEEYLRQSPVMGVYQSVPLSGRPAPLGSQLQHRLLLINGSPRPSLLCQLGIKLEMAPKLVLTPVQLYNAVQSRGLVSHPSAALIVRMITVGIHASDKTYASRKQCLQDQMTQYQREVLEGKHIGVDQCRAVRCHGLDLVSVEQQVTFLPYASNESSWSALLFNDSGRAGASPPWALGSGGQTQFLPLGMHSSYSLSPSSSKRAFETPDNFSRPNPCRSRAQHGEPMHPSVRSLCRQDPFTMAFDLLETSAISYSQALELLRHLHGRMGMDEDYQTVANMLRNDKDFLDSASHYFRQVLTFVEAREFLSWPRTGPDSEVKMQQLARRLTRDFTELKTEAAALSATCSESITIAMNTINIKDAKSNLEQTKRMQLLTFLAYGFIPMTFIASCFGMNLDRINDAHPPWWSFFAVALPFTCIFLAIPIWLEFSAWMKITLLKPTKLM